MTNITSQYVQQSLTEILKKDYVERYNYAAVAEEMNDNFEFYGIAEYEVPAMHTISGNPFVLRA